MHSNEIEYRGMSAENSPNEFQMQKWGDTMKIALNAHRFGEGWCIQITYNFPF